MGEPDSNESFFQKLGREIPRWTRQGIIAEEQGRKILALYRDPARAEASTAPEAVRSPAGVSARLPAILIGIAVLLIGTGIILFYAANWRRMSPTLKLIQIALLLLGTYGAAFYFLLIERRRVLLGRGFLLIGMISYGAAIGLVAQIYHISAHPAQGVLIWMAGTIAISAIMEERWGYYLGLIQGFVWNAWRYFEFQDPNYVFIAVPLFLGFLFYRKGDGVGLLFCVFEILFWFYQINFHFLESAQALHPAASNAPWVLLIYLHIPLGLLLVSLRRIRPEGSFLNIPLAIMTVFGWLLVFGPLMALSWPMDLEFRFFFDTPATRVLLFEYALLLGGAGTLLFFAYRRGNGYLFPALCAVFALLLPFLPMGHKTVLLIVTHTGLVAFIAGSLYFFYSTSSAAVERILAIALTILALAVKGLGFFLFGMIEQEQFFIAYCLGFVIFATVVFLINQFVRHAIQAPYPAYVLSAATSFFVFLILYALSYKITDQKSIFTASAVVLTLLVLFILLAVFLFALLWIKGSERLPLGLSGLIFGVALVVLLSAGPDVPWQYYSVVFNLLLFIKIGTLIYYSTVINSTLLANLAIGGLVLQIVTRYFDLFWDLLSGSALFIITGILLFGGGYLLERNRERLIAKIQEQEGKV